jgi:hypothetical protein
VPHLLRRSGSSNKYYHWRTTIRHRRGWLDALQLTGIRVVCVGLCCCCLAGYLVLSLLPALLAGLLSLPFVSLLLSSLYHHQAQSPRRLVRIPVFRSHCLPACNCPRRSCCCEELTCLPDYLPCPCRVPASGVAVKSFGKCPPDLALPYLVCLPVCCAAAMCCLPP